MVNIRLALMPRGGVTKINRDFGVVMHIPVRRRACL